MQAPSKIKTSENYPLTASGSWPEAKHQFEQDDINAIETAIASGRPLLVRGEPGTGKSQLARAAAKALGRYFVYEVISAKTESEDLLWHFDAISRLGEAQKLGAVKVKDDETVETALKADKFLSPGAVWWALNYASADKQLNKKCKHRRTVQIDFKAKNNDKQGAVLLIDEIDKGDADFANGLLETMGNLSFSVPWLDECDSVISLSENTPKPLVIITTNEERELPPAFVRRCMVLDLSLPEEDDELKKWLCNRGEIQFGDKTDHTVRQEAAIQLLADRKEAKSRSVSPPGQAEYLDILRAVSAMESDYGKQKKLLDKISKFALKKYPDDR